MLRLDAEKLPYVNIESVLAFDIEVAGKRGERVKQKEIGKHLLYSEENVLVLSYDQKLTKNILNNLLSEFEDKNEVIEYVWSCYITNNLRLKIRSKQTTNDDAYWGNVVNTSEPEHDTYVDTPEKKNGFFSFFRY